MSVVVSIVLGSYNRKNFLKSTIRSVRENGISVPYEIIVVDGGSDDGSLSWLSRQKDVITIIQHNRGVFRGKNIERRSWGYFMNLGFKSAQGKYVVMISDDCLLVPGAIINAVQLADNKINEGCKLGALAFYWRNWPTDDRYMIGLTFDRMFVNHGLYVRDALQEIGWIDENGYSFYHADSDLSLRLWENGYQVGDSPNSFVEHFIHANFKVRKSNTDVQSKDWQRYLDRWAHLSHLKVGSWVYKEYTDAFSTSKKFPNIEVFKYYARSKFYIVGGFVKKKIKTVINFK